MILSDLIRTIKAVYANEIVDVVDKDGNFCYLSGQFRQLFSIESEAGTLAAIPTQFSEIVEKTWQINNSLLDNQEQVIRFIMFGSDFGLEHIVYEGSKRAVTSNNGPIIITIMSPLKSVKVSGNNLNSSAIYTSKFNASVHLSELESLIIFYLSVGFKLKETYLYISKNHKPELEYENYRYYCKKIIKKFGMGSMDEVLKSIPELNEHCFIPECFLKNNLLTI